MAKKYPSELNTKTVRIGIGAWALLTELSRRADVTIAEALDMALKGHEPEPEPVKVDGISPAQIPMPVTIARSTPVTTARRRSTPVTASFSREVENVTNGHRQAD